MFMKTVTASTASELGSAIKENVDEIVIDGDLKKLVFRIKATGKVAWLVAIGAIAVAILFVVTSPGSAGVSAAFAIAVAPVAVSVLGVGATVAAISIAIAAGGVYALNRLRNGYRLESQDGKTVLVRTQE